MSPFNPIPLYPPSPGRRSGSVNKRGGLRGWDPSELKEQVSRKDKINQMQTESMIIPFDMLTNRWYYKINVTTEYGNREVMLSV